MNYLQAHENAVSTARNFRVNESKLISAIQEVIRTRAWTYFEKYSSLHVYVVEALGLSEDQAYQFTRIAEKAMEVPELDNAIQAGTLKLSNARRILKVMTPETKNEWIEKASHLKQRELEKEVVKEHPKEAVKERIKPIAEDVYELRAAIPKDVEEMIARVKYLESQRTRKAAGLVDVLRQTCLAYLKAHAPLLKARRNLGKPQTNILVSRQIPASIKHEVRNRDKGQCTYPGCVNRRWLDVHHVRPVSEGGPNTVKNLLPSVVSTIEPSITSRGNSPELLRSSFVPTSRIEVLSEGPYSLKLRPGQWVSRATVSLRRCDRLFY